MKAFGAQSQRFDGIVSAIGASHPRVWKVINPDSDILRAIKGASPATETIVRVYTGAPTVDDAVQHPDAEAYGREYATKVYASVADPAHMDLLESENEVNDHYGNLTEFIKRLNAFLVGFSARAKQLGFRPLGPNFSTGYPEVFIPGSDYELWPNAWQGLVGGLRALRDANGALSLHEYDSPELFRLWSDAKQRGYLVGRHKAIYECLPPDLNSLPLYITEFGIDWLTQGVEGGYWHNRGDDAYAFMIQQSKDAWKRIYSTTPQLRGIAFFLWGTTDPHFDEYDIRRTDASVSAFTSFFAEELVAQPTMPFTFTHYPFSRAYPISQPFGANPAYYAQFGLPAHEGVDYACPTGTPVLSVAAGRISLVSQSGNYGNHVTIDHADGWQTTYAHLSRIDVTLNELVDAGVQIGLSGQSGNATGPHLHLTLKHLGFTYTDANGIAWPFNIFDPSAVNSLTPTGVIMSTAQERITRAWNSIGIPYNPDAAFPKTAKQLNLGRPVGKEYTNIDGFSGQGFERAFLESPAGDVLSAKPYDWLSGEAYTPTTTPPVIVPPPVSIPTRLTEIRLDDGTLLPFKVTPYAPAPGESFWGLVAAGGFKLNVGTEFQIITRDAAGTRFGIPVVNSFGNFERFQSDGTGTVKFDLGHGSAFTPPADPPNEFFVSDMSTPPTRKGDSVKVGFPGGAHVEGSFTFMLMQG